MKRKQRFYTGTYTEPILFGTGEILDAKGEGIYLIELDCDKKTLSVEGVTNGVRNPSYLALSPDRSIVYAVNELKEYEGEEGGSVSAFRIIPESGKLELCDRKPTHGQDPCHVAVSEDGNFVIVSNFMTGSICVYRAGVGGKLEETDFIRHHGFSRNPVRQKGPHAHSCIRIKGTNRIMIPDLGIDKLMVYQIGSDGKAVLCDEAVFDCPPGNGPRFGEFLPGKDIFYLINELASSVSVLEYRRENGTFQCLQEIETLPEPCENICADLHVTGDGRFVYASNRGHDSITVFRVNPADSTLRRLFNVPCGGRTPRNFAIDSSGQFLLVGNQDSDEIVLFEIEQESGEIAERYRLGIANPVCICAADSLIGNP